jgi:hypothetical protein
MRIAEHLRIVGNLALMPVTGTLLSVNRRSSGKDRQWPAGGYKFQAQVRHFEPLRAIVLGDCNRRLGMLRPCAAAIAIKSIERALTA